MDRSDVKELYFITLISNVKSIMDYGILSHKLSFKIPHNNSLMFGEGVFSAALMIASAGSSPNISMSLLIFREISEISLNSSKLPRILNNKCGGAPVPASVSM